MDTCIQSQCAGIMVRLMLVAAPAFVLLGAIGISNLLHAYASEFNSAGVSAAGMFWQCFSYLHQKGLFDALQGLSSDFRNFC